MLSSLVFQSTIVNFWEGFTEKGILLWLGVRLCYFGNSEYIDSFDVLAIIKNFQDVAYSRCRTGERGEGGG